MNAIQFIKDHGIEKAREVVEGAPETATHFTEALGGHYAKEGMLKMKPQWLWFNSINKEWYYDFAAKDHIHLPDLKRLVKSINLVEFEGGLYKAKNVLFLKRALGLTPHADRLEQAIADYESIGGESIDHIEDVNEMVDDLHIEDRISPHFKKYDERVKHDHKTRSIKAKIFSNSKRNSERCYSSFGVWRK